MTKNDKQALELAMKILARDKRWGPHLQERLAGTRYKNPFPDREWIHEPQPWEEVAKFAARICQRDALNLTPWEYPPCNAHRTDHPLDNDGSEKLRDRMLAAGVSIYHPDPLRALGRSEMRYVIDTTRVTLSPTERQVLANIATRLEKPRPPLPTGHRESLDEALGKTSRTDAYYTQGEETPLCEALRGRCQPHPPQLRYDQQLGEANWSCPRPKETQDPGIVAATMARPGVVLKRPVGSNEPFSEDAKLPRLAEIKRGKKSRSKPQSESLNQNAQACKIGAYLEDLLLGIAKL